MVEVAQGDRHERGRLVPRSVHETVEAALRDDPGAHRHDAQAGPGEGAAKHVRGDGKVAGLAPAREFSGKLIPGVFVQPVIATAQGAQEVAGTGRRGPGGPRRAGGGVFQEGQDAALQQPVAVGKVVDDLGIGDEDAALAGGRLARDRGLEQTPQIRQILRFQRQAFPASLAGRTRPAGRRIVRQLQGGAGHHQRSEQRTVARFVYSRDNHAAESTPLAAGGQRNGAL